MCSIIGLQGKAKEIKHLVKKFKYELTTMLKTKGGDTYKAVIINHQYNIFTEFSSIDYECQDFYDSLDLIFDDISVFCDGVYVKKAKLSLMLFSRLTPEMENESNSKLQPYYNKDTNEIISIHGTIPKANEYNSSIDIDTEIFESGSIENAINFTNSVGGKISLLSINVETGVIGRYHNGLGQFSYRFSSKQFKKDIVVWSNIDYRDYLMVDNKDISKMTPICMDYDKTINYNDVQKPTRIISLFSGGLDITCSTWRAIHDEYYTLTYDQNDNRIQNLQSVDLWYFDWGTRAANMEINAGINFKNILADNIMLSNVSINHEVIPVTDMFRNILGACNTTVRLNDTNAIGAGSHEAEAAISYVPFRNQFLLTLAAAKAEQLYPNEKVIFILGANLSEGMIYLDNSEPFITSMNQVVKVGGQSCFNFEVVAPFVNRTKTDMVKYAIKHHYDLSTVYSCYFPKEDGSPCGECGSCLLHDNALARSK